ncbi:MAG: hypothetical protein ACTSVY_08370 [Candidatus Helarchaeota archaeon]
MNRSKHGIKICLFSDKNVELEKVLHLPPKSCLQENGDEVSLRKDPESKY